MFICHVDLRDLASIAVAGVGNIEAHLIAVTWAAVRWGFGNRQTAVCEAGVGKSVSERKERFGTVVFISPITDEDPFLINHSLPISSGIVAFIARVIAFATLKRNRQTP